MERARPVAVLDVDDVTSGEENLAAEWCEDCHCLREQCGCVSLTLTVNAIVLDADQPAGLLQVS